MQNTNRREWIKAAVSATAVVALPGCAISRGPQAAVADLSGRDATAAVAAMTQGDLKAETREWR